MWKSITDYRSIYTHLYTHMQETTDSEWVVVYPDCIRNFICWRNCLLIGVVSLLSFAAKFLPANKQRALQSFVEETRTFHIRAVSCHLYSFTRVVENIFVYILIISPQLPKLSVWFCLVFDASLQSSVISYTNKVKFYDTILTSDVVEPLQSCNEWPRAPRNKTTLFDVCFLKLFFGQLFCKHQQHTMNEHFSDGGNPCIIKVYVAHECRRCCVALAPVFNNLKCFTLFIIHQGRVVVFGEHWNWNMTQFQGCKISGHLQIGFPLLGGDKQLRGLKWNQRF